MIGVEQIGGALQCVPVIEFEYPDDGERETPVVRDQWVEAPLVMKCQQRFDFTLHVLLSCHRDLPRRNALNEPFPEARICNTSFCFSSSSSFFSLALANGTSLSSSASRSSISRT